MKKSKSKTKTSKKTNPPSTIRRDAPVVREFDDFMWDGYSGCKAWDNGDEPVYCSINGYLIVADSQCVNVSYPDHSFWSDLDVQFPSQAAAISFLYGLDPESFDPWELGFVRSDERRLERRKAEVDKRVLEMFFKVLRMLRDIGGSLKDIGEDLETEAAKYLETLDEDE